jgi:hypothetical protein
LNNAVLGPHGVDLCRTINAIGASPTDLFAGGSDVFLEIVHPWFRSITAELKNR